MNVEVEISGATTHPHCPVATIHCVIDNDDEKNDDEDDDDGDCVESGGDAEYGRKIGLDDVDDADDDDDANDLYIIGAVCLSVCLCVSKSHYFCIQRI